LCKVIWLAGGPPASESERNQAYVDWTKRHESNVFVFFSPGDPVKTTISE